MKVRLTATGQREDGKSVFVSDQQREPVMPVILGGNEVFELWGSETVSQLPTDGGAPRVHGFFPPPEGFRFNVWSIPPADHVAPAIEDFDAAVAECDVLIPGMTDAVTDAEGMHMTDTIDCLYILEGEVELTLDSGEAKTFSKGDCIIQNGTNHSWSNKGSETCVLLTAFLGARRA